MFNFISNSKHVNIDERVYNFPNSDQIVAIWVEDNNENILLEENIVVYAHSSERVHKIKHYYECYDPLQYALVIVMDHVIHI